MKRSWITSGLVILALVVVWAVMPASSLDFKVLSVSERAASIDLPPDFQMASAGKLDANSSGMVSYDFILNSTNQSDGAAFISVITVYDQFMKTLRPELLSNLFLAGGLSGAKSSGDVDVGNWTTTSALGDNVTVHVLQTKNPSLISVGGKYNVACWPLDQSTYALMVAIFDNNTTEQIIKTMEVS